MTTQQLGLFSCLYLVILAVVAVLTRATTRRVVGALAGAAVAVAAALVIVALGETAGWWHKAIPREPYSLMLMCLAMTPAGFVFLLTWRLARRFCGRGLALAVLAAAVLGPVRDYAYLQRFPEWGFNEPGFVPVLAVSAAYIILGILGHGTMRLIAGPASADPLARRPWEQA